MDSSQWIGQIDQMHAGSVALAECYAKMHKTLTIARIPSEEATQIVVSHINAMNRITQ